MNANCPSQNPDPGEDAARPADDRAVIHESTLTCPTCGHARTESMPTNACMWFYECEGCHAVLKPRPGDCCVFCSYGTQPCPPIQEVRAKSRRCG